MLFSERLNCIVYLAEGECLCHVGSGRHFWFVSCPEVRGLHYVVLLGNFNWILPVQEVERGEENLSSLDKILSDPENFPTTEEIIREMASAEKSHTFSPLKINVCGLNFELPGQFKKNNLSRTPYETWMPGKWSIFLSEYALYTCQNYTLPPSSLPPKNCQKNGEYLLISFFVPIIKNWIFLRI